MKKLILIAALIGLGGCASPQDTTLARSSAVGAGAALITAGAGAGGLVVGGVGLLAGGIAAFY